MEDGWKAEADDWRASADRLRAERDKLSKRLDHAYETIDTFARERDAALAEVKELKNRIAELDVWCMRRCPSCQLRCCGGAGHEDACDHYSTCESYPYDRT